MLAKKELHRSLQVESSGRGIPSTCPRRRDPLNAKVGGVCTGLSKCYRGGPCRPEQGYKQQGVAYLEA